MLKRLFSLLLAAAVCIGALSATAAAEAYSRIIDDLGLLTDNEYLTLYSDLRDAADLSDISMAIVIEDLGQHSDSSERRTAAEEFYDRYFSRERGGVVLIVDVDPETLVYSDYTYLHGAAYDLYQPHIEDIYSDMYAAMDSAGIAAGLSSFVSSLYSLAGKSGGSDNTGVSGDSDSTVTPSEPDEPQASLYRGVLSDLEGKFTSVQEQELTDLLTETANDIECNVGVVLTDDLGGKSDRKYADDFLDSTFGLGSSAIVLLYNDDRSNMNYTDRISANGRGTDLYGGKTDAIFDRVYAGSLGVKKDVYPASDYYESIENFCRYLSSHKGSGAGGSPYESDFDISFDSADIANIAYVFIMPAIIGLVVSISVTANVCARYKKKKPLTAAAYINSGRTKYLNKTDIFVREYTTHVRISSSSHSSGGGHRSGGGGHRSGRSGGGGRRR